MMPIWWWLGDTGNSFFKFESAHSQRQTHSRMDWMRHSFIKVSNVLQLNLTAKLATWILHHQMNRRPQNCSTKLSAQDGWCIVCHKFHAQSSVAPDRPKPLHSILVLFGRKLNRYSRMDAVDQFMKMTLTIYRTLGVPQPQSLLHHREPKKQMAPRALF